MVQQTETGREAFGGLGLSQTPSKCAASAPQRRRSTDRSAGPLLLSVTQAAAAMGVSERQFHLMRAAGIVCAPIELGPRCLRWSRADLAESIATLPRTNPKPEPLQLAKRRAAKSGTTQVSA